MQVSRRKPISIGRIRLLHSKHNHNHNRQRRGRTARRRLGFGLPHRRATPATRPPRTTSRRSKRHARHPLRQTVIRHCPTISCHKTRPGRRQGRLTRRRQPDRPDRPHPSQVRVRHQISRSSRPRVRQVTRIPTEIGNRRHLMLARVPPPYRLLSPPKESCHSHHWAHRQHPARQSRPARRSRTVGCPQHRLKSCLQLADGHSNLVHPKSQPRRATSSLRRRALPTYWSTFKRPKRDDSC